MVTAERALPPVDRYDNRRLPYFVFYRRSELMLYFETADGDQPSHDDGTELLESLRRQEIPVHPKSAFEGPNETRKPIYVQRNGQVRGVLHTVNLDTWLSEAARQHKEAGGPAYEEELKNGYKQVSDAAVQLANQLKASGGFGELAWGNMKLAAAAPNWLVGPLVGFDCGPAGRPTSPWFNPAAPARIDPANPPRFRLPATGATKPPLEGDGDGVIVAMFDTWPAAFNPHFDAYARIKDRASLIADKHDADSSAPPQNVKLTAMGEKQIVLEGNVHDCVPPSHNSGWQLAPYGCGKIHEKPYEMADHGLFVADIINDIAPKAEIRVYRALNHNGLGDLDTLARAIQQAIADARDSPKKLIFNFSLGISPSAMLVEKVLADPSNYYLSPQQVAEDLHALTHPIDAPMTGREFDPHTAIDEMRTGGLIDKNVNRFAGPLGVIQKLFDRVEADNVLAIAAAGNDSCGTSERFLPRLPAAVEGVLAVSAFAGADSKSLRLASYSNIDDFFNNLGNTTDDGVGAFGGEVAQRYAVDGDALVGLYSGEFLPPGTRDKNAHGWAEWSGTSFATPVVTGVAACLWSKNLGATATAVRRQLQMLCGAKPNDCLPFMQQ